MNTALIKKFAQNARRALLEQINKKLDRVLAPNSIYRREKKNAIIELEKQLQKGREHVITTAAYTWFNRFCALRFMDLNGYINLRIVSPAEGQSQPEILTEAKAGHIDERLIPQQTRSTVLALLSRQLPSDNPEQEAYALLFLAACNHYNQEMPFLFEKIQDYTELLIPDDLLSDNSVLSMAREALTKENCARVEVIGWLYQYYISERKDEIFADLKKNKKIESPDIPAATQLFTPEWIVRYMVENSLGRLWMQNFPASHLIEHMEYFILDDSNENGHETSHLKISSPEEIRFCDPACGSGHILVVAFELLYHIYEEQGYDAIEIPALILQKNLVGFEIDKRAADLASFALCMKAREKDRRFFKRKNENGDRIKPDILVFENVDFSEDEINEIIATGIAKKAKEMLIDNQSIETSPYWHKISKEQEKIEKKKLDAAEDKFNRIESPEEKDVKALERARAKYQKSKDLNPALFKNFVDAMHYLSDASNSLELIGAKKLKLKSKLDRIKDSVICRESFFSNFRTALNSVHQYLCNIGRYENFGSLIIPVIEAHKLLELYKQTKDKFMDSELLRKINLANFQKNYLAQPFHVVVANPPYMGGKGMNENLSKFAASFYPASKSDLFAMFIERGFSLCCKNGFSAMVTMQSWMFLSSYEKLRKSLLENQTIQCMVHMANMVMGIAFGTSATVWCNSFIPDYKGYFCYVKYEDIDANNKPAAFPPDNDRNRAARKASLSKQGISDIKEKSLAVNGVGE